MFDRDLTKRELLAGCGGATVSGISVGILVGLRGRETPTSTDSRDPRLSTVASVPTEATIVVTIVEYTGDRLYRSQVRLEDGEQTFRLSELEGDPNSQFRFKFDFAASSEPLRLESPVVLEL